MNAKPLALLGPAQIRQLAEKLGVSPTKKLGQNFVHDAGTVRRIAAQAGVGQSDVVLEVGPGLGSLTLALLEAGSQVVAVEIDERLAQALPSTVATVAPEEAARLGVINQDALTLEGPALHALPQPLDGLPGSPTARPTALVANLPYNVAVPVLLTVLAQFPSVKSGVVMVQKEVADRLIASPGSRTYGAPTVKLAWYGTSKSAGTVGRKVFWPEPNVDSALVAFERGRSPRGGENLREATFGLIDAAFGQRRKMIRSSLKSQFESEEAMAGALAAASLSGTERPEELTIDQFTALAESVIGSGS